jgi:hypothetical protein
MGLLAEGLRPFVNKRMTAAFPRNKDWLSAWAARNTSSYRDGQRYSLADPRLLLRVITEEWRLFKDQLTRVEQGFATELRDAGNRWAHGEPFSAEDAYRTLDTMERLLTAVGATSQASQLRTLRLDLQATTRTASGDGGQTARPSLPSPEPAKRTGGFWSPVTQADVVRAIEEYDRLGQEQFLAEHGFGRATAYLLIHRGRSYDSKAILGVAYKFATGVHIGAHGFSGGIYGAAGVLRKLGFEVRNTRNSTAPATIDRAGTKEPVTAGATAAARAPGVPQLSGGSLERVIPERALLVVTCSGRKETGGRPPGQADSAGWPPDLVDARVRVLASAKANTALVLPAWRRYTGTFYQHARSALADAVTAGHVAIISGGYGVARADEPIGWYDKMLQLADWPAGVLESALIAEARRCEVQTVVAFASATTDYARLLRRTPWVQAGIDARLVTITGVTGGAMSEVPRQLAQAFTAFWNRAGDYPPGMTVEMLQT